VIRVRNANGVARRLWRVDLASHRRPTGPWLQKNCRIHSESCSSILRIQLRLIFDYHTLNGAMLGRSSVIHTNPLTRSQRRRHSLAGRVNNVRSRAECETHRALLAPDDNRLAGLICCHCTRLVSCARSRCSRRSCRRCGFFGRGRTGLCKRQWRNQSADQSNDCSLHSMPPCYLFTSTVRDSDLKRTLFVRNLLIRFVMPRFGVFAEFIDLSGHREFGNMECQ